MMSFKKKKCSYVFRKCLISEGLGEKERGKGQRRNFFLSLSLSQYLGTKLEPFVRRFPYFKRVDRGLKRKVFDFQSLP